MSKIVLILFTAVVASKAQQVVDTLNLMESQEAKYECIGEINTLLNQIYESYKSVDSYLNEYSRQDIIRTVGPMVRELLAHLKKVRKLDIPKSDSELEIFDKAMERCDELVRAGPKFVAYMKDFTNLNWGFVVPRDDHVDFGGDFSRPINFDHIRLPRLNSGDI